MSQLETQIQQAAAKNKELLAILAETDHAIPDLEQQCRFVAELESEAAESRLRVIGLERKRAKELKDHEKYRDSHVKRFMHKAVGKREKFEEKAAKEEREYFEVLQEEHKEKEINKSLNAQLMEAREVKSQLEEVAAKHTQMQQELDNLYNAIFSGPTPSFPEEDQREQASAAALQEYHETRGKLEAEAHAVRLLVEAAKNVNYSLSYIEEALSHSRMDMFGGGTMSDMMERSALQRAELHADDARRQVTQAQRMSPFVGELPPVMISHGNLMSDVFFDNIFTDMAFHDKIKNSRESVRAAAEVVRNLLQEAKSRHQSLQTELKEKEKTLEESRVALQKEREKVFDRVLGQASGDQPPAYEPPAATTTTAAAAETK